MDLVARQAHRRHAPVVRLRPRQWSLPNGVVAPTTRYTIVFVSVYDELPTPAAGLLQLARHKAGITQAELAGTCQGR